MTCYWEETTYCAEASGKYNCYTYICCCFCLKLTSLHSCALLFHHIYMSLQDHLGVITAAWTMCPSRQEQKPRQTSNVHNIQPLLAACESTHHNSKVWPKLYINYVIILQTEAIGNAFWNNNAEYSRVSPQLYSVTITVGKCIVQRDVTTAVSLYPFSIEVIHTRAANVKLTPGAKSHSSLPLEQHN